MTLAEELEIAKSRIHEQINYYRGVYVNGAHIDGMKEALKIIEEECSLNEKGEPR